MMTCMRIHKCKGLDIKPPDLGVGVGLPLVVHGDGTSHVIQRVGTSMQGRENNQLIINLFIISCCFHLPIIQQCPYGVPRCWVGKAIPYMQRQSGVWGWLSDGNLYICRLLQWQNQWKLILRKVGCERCI